MFCEDINCTEKDNINWKDVLSSVSQSVVLDFE